MEAHERLKGLRLSMGLTIQEIAEKVSMSTSGWGMVERGHNAISPRLVSLLKMVFKVNERWLLKGEGEMFSVQGVRQGGRPQAVTPSDSIAKFMSENQMTIREMSERAGVPADKLAECINKGHMPHDLEEKIYAAFPELRPAALSKEQLQERVYHLEEELLRYKRIVDALTGQH